VAWEIHHAFEALARDRGEAPLVVDDEGRHGIGEVAQRARSAASAQREASLRYAVDNVIAATGLARGLTLPNSETED
jgi:hypothetical protein